MRRASSEGGFTLVELVIVLLLISALAYIVTPRYRKLVEDQRLDAARLEVESIAAANRMRMISEHSFSTGTLTNSHPLVVDRYLPPQDWTRGLYVLAAADPRNPCNVASATHQRDGSPFAGLGVCADPVGVMYDYVDGACPIKRSGLCPDPAAKPAPAAAGAAAAKHRKTAPAPR